MRPVDAAAQAERERRVGEVATKMVWIAARNRTSGVLEGIGLWLGRDDETIRVRDLWTQVEQPRGFYGAGSLLSVGSVKAEAGLTVRPIDLELSPLHPAVIEIIKVRDARGAPIQIWNRTYHPETMAPLGVEPVFKGYISSIRETRPAPGGAAKVAVSCVSTARTLTIASALKRSHETQLARAPGDNFFRHKRIAAQTPVFWGTKDERQK